MDSAGNHLPNGCILDSMKPNFKEMKHLFWALLLVFPALAQGQMEFASDKVKAAYSSQELSEMTAAEIDMLNFQAEKGYAFAQQRKEIEGCIPAAELQHRVTGEAAQIDNPDDFNLLEYNFVQDENVHTTYCFENGMVLLIYSKARVETLYERNKINAGTKQTQR